jgi:exopolyphosphatase/pppGpp-phosphohydrolase
MYIRRKVFSVLQDESGEERYFSTTDYVYDDRMFSEDGEKKPLSRGAKIAIGTAGTAALAAGSIYGAKKLGQHIIKNTKVTSKGYDKLSKKLLDGKITEEQFQQALAKNKKLGANLQKPADFVVAKSKAAKDFIVKHMPKKKATEVVKK